MAQRNEVTDKQTNEYLDEGGVTALGLCSVYSFSSLPCDARSAKRGTAIVSRPSVCPSVRPSVTLKYRENIGWTSSKLITRIISLGSSLLGRSHNNGNLVQREHA